jgi:hypothetical protein
MSRLLWIVELTKRALGSEPPDTEVRTFSKPEISQGEYHQINALNILEESDLLGCSTGKMPGLDHLEEVKVVTRFP